MKTVDKTGLEAGIAARLRGVGLAAAVGLLLSGTALAAEHDRWTHEKEFVPNPSCTIGDAWDPDVDRPSHTALRQLAPSHNMLRIGVATTNRSIASPFGSILVGPAIDISCRLAVKLRLPIEFHTYPPGNNLAGFRNHEFEIGYAFDTTQPPFPSDVAVANPYIGVENTYFVLVDSPFESVSDVDRPGVIIGVAGGTAPDAYLTKHLQFATLVDSYPDPATALKALKAGQVTAAAAGRPAGASNPDPAYRALPDDIFVAFLGPYVAVNNEAAVCYLSDYIEGSKKSGLIQQAITRASAPPFNPLVGDVIPGPMATCEHGDDENDTGDRERRKGGR
jgi:polar amino acid transport system substrate-binding protein